MRHQKQLLIALVLAVVGCGQDQQNDLVEQNDELASTNQSDGAELSEPGSARYIRQEEFEAPFGKILVGEYDYADVDIVGHPTPGRLDVSYLVDGQSRRDFRKAVEVGSNGRMAEWEITRKFTGNPVIYASGGFTNMGVTEGCTVLTELTADGPRAIATIPDYSGGTADDGKEYGTEGKIAAIKKGQSFVVNYRGPQTGSVAYRWTGERFEPLGKPVLEHCGFE